MFFAYFYTEREIKQPTKEKNSIYTYRVRKEKRVKTATKGHKKRGHFVAPLIPGKCTLTTKALRAY